MMFINGFLFMVTKHAALAQQEDIFEDHPKFAMTFAILLIGSGTGLGICAMLGMTQYYLVNENIIKKWNTDEFKMIRREYVSQLDAADALKGKFLELILGYLGLMAFHIQVALAGWYIFSKSRVEKLQQLKEQRTQRKNFGKDGSRRMRASQRHTKEVVIMVACFCITVFFGISWILASNEQNCDSAPVLDGFKASLIDTNTSATLHSTETTMEDKVDESPVTHVFDREFEVKVLCKMEMESDEVIGVEYRIFAADGALDHLLFKYDGATDLVRPCSSHPVVRCRSEAAKNDDCVSIMLLLQQLVHAICSPNACFRRPIRKGLERWSALVADCPIMRNITSTLW